MADTARIEPPFEDSRDYVQSLARGLSVLRAFDAQHTRLSLADIAARTAMSRAAARRLVMTLEHLGYVRASGREYVLSPSVLELGFGYLGSLNLTDLAQPLLDDLARTINQSSSMAVLDGQSIVYVLRVPGRRIMYLDEEPITTIQGALDIHIYDIARVESLSGPQGTLYGASSEAGTIRIITNKPDPGVFAAGYGVEANAIDGGGTGWVTEAFVNAPLSESAAIRLVGWDKKDAGYIDNVSRPRTFPSSGITVDNTDRLEDDYNSVYTTGARAALKIDINDSWSVMPTLMGQHQVANGSFAFDESIGDLQVSHRFPDTSDDLWTQAGLTVLGKIGNFDVTYAFSHLKRNVDTESDYADYSYWYDVLYGYGAYICDIYDPVAGGCAPGGSLIDPTQYIMGKDQYTKRSNELRIASPSDQRLRFVAGLFWQQQNHDIQQQYKINGLSPQQSVAGWPDTIWLTKQVRRDHDEAIFGELSFDFTDKLTGTIGGRHFRTENSLEGFFGFGDWGWVSSYGQAICPEGAPTFHGAPCETFNKTTSETGTLGRANLTYEFDDERM